LLNQAFFKRILIGGDSEVLGATLTPIYAALASWRPQLGKPGGHEAHRATLPTSQEVQKENPDPISQGQGSLVEPMVETVGIEPTSAIA
jgi:hypothetical protein